jgi:adenine deaminase
MRRLRIVAGSPKEKGGISVRELSELKALVACGKGELSCDYRLSNVQLVNFESGEIYPTNI